jgi:GMP reductase
MIEQKLNFDDVLIRPKLTTLKSRSEVNLKVSYSCLHSKLIIEGFPVIVANMSCVGTINMAKALYPHEFFVALHKFIPVNELIEFFNNEYSKNSFYTIGISDKEIEQLHFVKSKTTFLNKICLDVANGYMSIFLDKIKEIREKYPDVIILAGNVVTKEGVSSIINAGADIVKGGIANGGFCETKLKAGVGYKQFSMIRECSPLANEMGALFCSDGGCKTPADICKALGGGSNFVMVGSLFAGYDQCDSEWTTVDGQKKMLMYGMSSKIANDKYCGGLQSYRTSEGREGWVDYKGDVKELATDIKGSVASCCTYTDTKNLQDLRKNCVFTA